MRFYATSVSRTASITLTAILAALFVPATAGAEYLVPEGNSAVTQYTEGFPTAGGEKKTEGNKQPVTTRQAIGAGNAKKLEKHGPDGAAAAELAAETAPPQATSPSSDAGSGEQADRPQGKNHAKGGKPDNDPPAKRDSDTGETENTSSTAPVSGGDGPEGSSGLGEVLGAATGSSSGSLGLLLPLVIVAALAWGTAFLWRHRRHHHEPTADGNP